MAPASRSASAWTRPRPRAAPDTITTSPSRLNSGRREAVPKATFWGEGEVGGGGTEERGFIAENWRARVGVDAFGK